MPATDGQTPDPLALSEEFDTLSKLASTKEFLGLLNDIRVASESDRPEVAKRLVTLTELANRGVQIPASMRLTLRYFEERPDKTVSAALTDTNEPPPPPEQLARGGWTVCATTGASTGGVISCASIGRLL